MHFDRWHSIESAGVHPGLPWAKPSRGIVGYRYVDGTFVEKSPMINDQEEISRLFLRFVDLKVDVFRESWNMDLKKK